MTILITGATDGLGLETVTGRYFNGQREARADPQAYEPEARRRLRALSEWLTGVDPLELGKR